MPSISLRDVGVLTPHPLFQNLTMTIGDADRIGLIAGNGGGKTTLLRCLAGLAEPTSRRHRPLARHARRLRRAGRAGEPAEPAARRGDPPRAAAGGTRQQRMARRCRARRVRRAVRSARSPAARAERRLAAAGADRARLGDRAGRAAARRADQPSGPREDPDAGALDRRVPRADGDRQPRPAASSTPARPARCSCGRARRGSTRIPTRARGICWPRTMRRRRRSSRRRRARWIGCAATPTN